jgi:hypothetical protein
MFLVGIALRGWQEDNPLDEDIMVPRSVKHCLTLPFYLGSSELTM